MQEFHTHLSMAISEECIEIGKHADRTQYQLNHKYAILSLCHFITVSRKTIFDQIISSIAARTQKI